MRRSSTSSEDVAVPIAPMIDIVFLLIIFFVVTADMQKEAVDWQIKLATSQYLKVPDKTNPNTVTINIRYEDPATPPIISIGGQVHTHREVESRLRKAHDRHGSSVPVVIRANYDTPWREIEKINKRIANAGLSRVRHAARDME